MAKAKTTAQFHGITTSRKKPSDYTPLRAAVAAATVIAIGVMADNLPEALESDPGKTMIAIYMVFGAAFILVGCIAYWSVITVRHFNRGDACEIKIENLVATQQGITLTLRNTDTFRHADGCLVKVNSFEALAKQCDADQFIGRVFLTNADYKLLREKEVKDGDFSIPAGESVDIDLITRVSFQTRLQTNSFFHLNDKLEAGVFRMVIGIYGNSGKIEHKFKFELELWDIKLLEESA